MEKVWVALVGCRTSNEGDCSSGGAVPWFAGLEITLRLPRAQQSEDVPS
jgi:hypothetical protein